MDILKEITKKEHKKHSLVQNWHKEELSYFIKKLIDKAIKKQLTLTDVVASKRDETLELLEEIIIKVKEADSEIENGIYDPMLECAKSILNNYVIKRR